MSDEHRDDLVETAQRYLPGGSSWMWTLPRDISFVVDRAEGSHLFDTNGRRFIDYALPARADARTDGENRQPTR